MDSIVKYHAPQKQNLFMAKKAKLHTKIADCVIYEQKLKTEMRMNCIYIRSHRNKQNGQAEGYNTTGLRNFFKGFYIREDIPSYTKLIQAIGKSCNRCTINILWQDFIKELQFREDEKYWRQKIPFCILFERS